MRGTSLLLLGALSITVPAAAQTPAPSVPVAAPVEAPPVATGRIGGRVVDKETGRPIASARVQISGQQPPLESDLDGKYRSPSLAAGRYQVRATMIGYKAVLVDSVLVKPGPTTIVDFTLVPAPVELQELVTTAPVATKTGNDAGLLAIQQNAPAVTDGISAQAIARSPDKDAGEAVRRVTGVTVVGGKFLVVRGLGERYSNALLNGAEMPNPVLEKKIAPLDIFPAGLLESVVASKTATPDKPGDFAGGSVELTTKDFPETRVFTLSIGQRYTDRSSFKQLQMAPRGGTDWLGIDDGRRQGPYVPYAVNGSGQIQSILQSFNYQIWDPAARTIPPGTTAAFTYGDQNALGGNSALGYVASLTYENKSDYTPNRYYNIYYLGQEGVATVNWGAVGNITAKLGHGAKLGLRNLYTRSADEVTRSASGATGSTLTRFYEVRYVERALWQSQLFSSIDLVPLFRSNLELKATIGNATVDNPDNHSISYNTSLDIPGPPSITGTHSIRSLEDKTWSGQGDWTVPLHFRRQDDAQIKLGGSYRDKTRSFDARDLFIRPGGPETSPYLEDNIGQMAPDQAFAPENMGTYFTFAGPGPGQHDDAYEAVDKLGAAYAMVDAPILSNLRLVGGLRMEQWKLTLKPGGQDPQGSYLTKGTVITRDELDPLWSGNLTLALSERMNLRAAASRTLARPDSREISPGRNSAAAGIGDCEEVGNPDLKETHIINTDLRWELYPRPGELLAVSGFYKKFTDPIIEIRTVGGGGTGENKCSVANADNAELGGGEFELRRALDFLPGGMKNLSLGLNLTVVTSTIRFDPATGLQARDFIGQSPYVVNASMAYEPPGSPFSASVLYNFFAERIQKYANQDRSNGDPNVPPTPNPNWVEQSRGVLDAKIGIGLTSQLRLTFSGKNLTRAPVRVKEDAGLKRTVEYYNPGLTISFSATYAF
ncbi:MAG TPA: carboxypeptidase regulatory-like domain-containing protein [Gemmatimonadales bacterium]|nr:carboxypeptidase regulatory-like domain-containing protein [Gemmatimonadales bacterium]